MAPAAGLFIWCCIIYWLSDQSVLPTPIVFDGQDKLIHASVYAVMTWLFWDALKLTLSDRIGLLAILTIVFCSAYGGSDEWHQSFVQGRDASVYDWLADTAGAILLTGLLWKLKHTVIRP